jgi:20S proteasome alpha/beta subunit
MSLQVLVWTTCILQSFYLTSIDASSAAGTETLVGIVGPDFILLGADSSISQSIALTASNLDKIAVIANPFPTGRPSSTSTSTCTPALTAQYQQQTIAAAAAGDAADADRLLGILRAHAAIREYEASVGCDVEVVDFSKDSANQNSNGLTLTPAGLSVEAAARLARGQIASQLRSRTPLKVCLLVAGMMPIKDLPETSTLLTTQLGLSFTSEQVQRQVQKASFPYLANGSSSSSTSTTDSTSTTSTSQVALDTKDKATPLSPPSKLRPYLYWLDEYGSLQKLQYGAHGHGSNFILSILDQGYRPNLTRKEAADLLHECFAQLRTRYVINSPQKPCIKCIDADGCRLLR